MPNTSAEAEISNLLEPGEALVWSGRPRQGLRLRPLDKFLIPFYSFTFLALVGMFLVAIFKFGGQTFVLVALIPFAFVGLYALFGRFIVDAKQRAKSFYGLTNRRVVIIGGLMTSTTKSLLLDSLKEISLQEAADGNGSVVFGIPNLFSNVVAAVPWPGTSRILIPAFDLIEHAKQVHEQVLLTKRALEPTSK
jgi:hypothetical protein